MTTPPDEPRQSEEKPGHWHNFPTTPPYVGQPPTPPPPPTAHRKPPFYRRRWFLPTATGLAGLLIGAAMGSASSTTRTIAGPERTVEVPGPTLTVDRTITVTPSPAAKPKTTTPPKPAQVSFPGEGSFLVGEDIRAGTYRSAAPNSGMCYWARLSGTDPISDIIANNITSGPSVVTIRSGDVAFKTDGCEKWVKVG